MTWTSERPTVPGWYWVRATRWDRAPCIALLTMGLDSLAVNHIGIVDENPIEMYECEWAGPIPEPDDPGAGRGEGR